MAWQALSFGIRHSLRDRGVTNVTEQNAIASGDYEAFMLDERREVMSFAGAAADHHVQVDLGTGFASLTVDWLLIPVGHNFDSYDLRVREDDNAGMSSATVLYSVIPHSGTAQIDVAITESSERYLRLDWITDNFTPDIPEIWLSKKLTPSQGAQPTWGDQRFYNVQTFITPAGDRGDLQLGASQRIFELEFPKVYAAADIAILDQLLDTVGMEQAFLFQPPFDDEATLICRMAQPPERQFAYPAPANGTKGYSYRFWIVEQLV